MIKPTVIKTEEKREESKPTVIQPLGHTLPVQEQKQPVTVSKISIMPSAMPATAAKPEQSEPEPVNYQPTSMAGYKRDRLDVSADDLKAYFPEHTDSDLTAILQMILETNIETLDRGSIMFWQNQLQKTYSDQILILLSYSQNESLDKAQTRAKRVIEIMEAIDLMGVLEHSKSGMISRLLKSQNNACDTPEELKKAEVELSQLTALLSKESESLVQLQRNLTALNDQINKLGLEIKLASDAAYFLSKHLTQKDPDWSHFAENFEERSMSLTKTFSQIQANDVSRQVQLNHVLKLIATIQESILVLIPDWLGSITSIRSLIEMQKMVTQTEVMELVDRKKQILKLIK